MKYLEAAFRDFRDVVLRKYFSSRRGKKYLYRFMPEYVSDIVLSFPDHVLAVPTNDFVGREVFVNRDYDRASVENLFKYLMINSIVRSEGLCVLELGANIGTQSLYIMLEPAVEKVIAVEPDPRNLDFLTKNIRYNNFEESIIVVPMAASSKNETMKIHYSLGNSGGSSALHHNREAGSVTVEARTVPDLCVLAGLTEDSVDLVWMDIEGLEPAVIRSMSAITERGVPIFLEFSPNFYGAESTSSFVEFLREHYNFCVSFDEASPANISWDELKSTTRQRNILLRR
jgi:FkbM family methyltransferase